MKEPVAGPEAGKKGVGHPRLRMRHAPFHIGIPERDRWLKLMTTAMEETAVPHRARAFLDPFFAQIADFMRNQAE